MGATGSAPNGEGARGLVARREPQHHGLEKPADENNEGSEIVPDRKEAAQTGAEVGAVLRVARGGGGATAGGGVRLYDPHLLIAGPDAAPDGEEVERGDPAVVLRVRARLKYGDAQGRQVPQVPPRDPRGPLRSACAS